MGKKKKEHVTFDKMAVKRVRLNKADFINKQDCKRHHLRQLKALKSTELEQELTGRVKSSMKTTRKAMHQSNDERKPTAIALDKHHPNGGERLPRAKGTDTKA